MHYMARNQNVILLVFVALLMVLHGPAPGHAAALAAGAAEDATTEDVLYMRDGRMLRGKILSEEPHQILFRYVDPDINVAATITVRRQDIAEVKRGVPVEAAAGDREMEVLSEDPDDEEESREPAERGLTEGAADDASLPGFYVVPMVGQMGTDVHPDIYASLVDDIRRHDPNVILIVMDSKDELDEVFNAMAQQEEGRVDFDIFDRLAHLFRVQLRDYPQVLWVRDSQGISTMLALAWDRIYMTPDARFGGLQVVIEKTGADQWSDDDVRAKMVAAWEGVARSFSEYGGYHPNLFRAMIFADYRLSASWRGRTVQWHLDTSGEYVVNNSEKRTASFRAREAENLLISQGTVDTLDDMAMLLGYREYRRLDARAEPTLERYRRDWRREFERCVELLRDVQQHLGWASGEDELRYLGRVRRDLERILAAMNRFEAVEIRLRTDYGVTRFDIITQIEQIRERIRSIQQRGRDGGRRGGGGGVRGL